MKSLKEVSFMFNLTYEVKGVTYIKITHSGVINLKFASRKKDQEFFATATGEQIQPELFSANSVLNKDQHDKLLEILNYENFTDAFIRKINTDRFPNSIKGKITIKKDKINWEFEG